MIYQVSYKRFPNKVCCLPSIKLHNKLFLWKFIEKYFDFLRDSVNSGSSKKVFSGSALMHGAQPHSTIQNVAIDCLTLDRCLDAWLSSQLLLCHFPLLQLILYHFTGMGRYKRCQTFLIHNALIFPTTMRSQLYLLHWENCWTTDGTVCLSKRHPHRSSLLSSSHNGVT